MLALPPQIHASNTTSHPTLLCPSLWLCSLSDKPTVAKPRVAFHQYPSPRPPSPALASMIPASGHNFGALRCRRFLGSTPCFDFIRWSGCGSGVIRLFGTLPISPVLKHAAGEAGATHTLFGNGTSYSCLPAAAPSHCPVLISRLIVSVVLLSLS